MNELYLVTVHNCNDNKTFNILMKVKEFEAIHDKIKNTDYMITNAMLFPVLKKYKAFLKKLNKKNKPKGMVFGNKKEERND